MAAPALTDIRPKHWLGVALVVTIMAIALYVAGRHPICSCGHVALWHPRLDSGNSQHIADWYTPSHVIHGFLFYALGLVVARHWSPGARLMLAVAIEAAWEVLENSPVVIDRYREATMALGYSGDSILNSVADVVSMALGFAFARRAPPLVTIVVALVFEGLTLWAIRDNLTLNVVMLIAPIEAIKTWQGNL